MSEIKEKAARYRNLYNDPVFKEVMQSIIDYQVSVFLETSAKIEHVEEARSIVKAVQAIERHIKRAFSDEAMYDKANK